MADPQQTLAQMVRAKYPGVYDDLSDADLEAKVKAKYPGVYDDLPTTTAATQPQTQTPAPASGLRRYVSTAVEEANPITTIAGIVQAAKDPKAALAAAWDRQQAIKQKAQDEYAKGNYQDAAVHAFNYLIPLIGPKIDELAERGAKGDWSGLLGGATGLGVTMAVPELLKSAPASVTVPGVGVANRATAANLARAQSLGIPVDAATATANPVVRGVQAAADRTLLGAKIAAQAEEARAGAASGAIGNIAQRVSPTAATPETAGAGLRQELSNEMVAQHGLANTNYEALRQIEAKTPITVDFGATKQALQPLYDQMMRQLPVTVRDASPGWTALQQFMTGPTFRRLSDADADLSVIKGMAREGDPYLRSNGQRIAAILSSTADKDVQAAVQQAGPTAVSALQAGRAATKAKYAAADVLGQFADEPVKAFNQAVLREDAGIDRLRALQRTTPQALPQLGRAYLDDLVSDATQNQGFAGQRALRNWQALGPETKKLLIPDAGMRGDLDAIFSTMQRAVENPNPSGTAHQAWVLGQAGSLIFRPWEGVPLQVAGATVAKLLRTPAGVRILRDGMTLPVRSSRAIQALQKITETQAQTVGRMLVAPVSVAAQGQPPTTP